MNRIFSRVLTLGIAVTAIGAALPACAKNDKSLFIRNVVAPPSNRTNGTCLYSVDTQAPGLPSGVLDVDVLSSYSPFMLIGNQLIARADPLDPRAESNRVHLKGVVSRVTDENGNGINELTGNASGFADAASNGQPGYGLIQAALIDQNTITALNLAPGAFRQVLTQVRVFGTTLGGEDVESGEFQFVVNVCRGCLLTRQTVTPEPLCSSLTTSATGGTTIPCQLGQDERYTCTVCTSTAPGDSCK